MIKSKPVQIIEENDWNELVQDTYGRPYHFQQQDDCKSRGTFKLTIPCEYDEEDDMHDSIPEVVNGETMGVKFDVWLARDPKKKLPGKDDRDNWCLTLFWDRNFYPNIYTVANDLHKKGLIEAGEYLINIDW